jgi:superfamily II DNA or RNA helicase
MSNLDDLKPIYYPIETDLDEKVFFPISTQAKTLDCMVGYFTSGSFSELARSIVSYLSTPSRSKMRFIVSPNLSDRDLEAIKEAINYDENLIPFLFPDFSLDEITLKNNAVKALCFLVASGAVEIKIALMDQGLFHTKAWIFQTDRGLISVHGSGNATRSGISVNFEQYSVSRSWLNEDARYTCEVFKSKFDSLWGNDYPGVTSRALNSNTIEQIKKIKSDCKDFIFDKENMAKELANQLKVSEFDNDPVQRQYLKIPDWLNYMEGAFSHQGRAVEAWVNNKNRGILSIATGGGKTLTSLIAATLLNQKYEKLLVVISVPTTPLQNQWEEEVRKFDVVPFNTYKTSRTDIKVKLKGLVRRLKHGASKTEVIIVTHDSLASEVLDYLGSSKGIKTLLIGDEVHNLGSTGFKKKSPEYYDYRIGLSATHERHFDEDGSEFLLDYFGGLVFEYSLREAIGNCLVPFDYFVCNVFLTVEEEEKFTELSYQIKKLSFSMNLADGDPAKESLKRKCLERRRIIESAQNKIKKFSEILPVNKDAVYKTLIFCTDKYPEQIEMVNNILNQRSISFHQITQEETSDPKLLARVLKSFNSNELKVLTSKRVLDEGFNVPQTETAYLIACNTVKRQWIQRLGRVLRLSPKTNKEKAVVYDFMVLPIIGDNGLDADLESLIRSEYNRITFFSTLSLNGLEADGSVSKANMLLELIRK